MHLHTRLTRWLAALVGSVFLSFSLMLPSAQAAMIGTHALVQQEQLEQQRHELKQFLARDGIRDQLIAWGVNPDDARTRVDSLSAQEVAQMSERMQELPAGGDVLGAVVFIFLVLLVTDILGFTDIFPFVRSVRD
ncbi:MAG TPA: PA2779 family protein [Gammaproteobacteria bacterium]|nr:PA2779 family protein [Gammaproteobacteria bacterium]